MSRRQPTYAEVENALYDIKQLDHTGFYLFLGKRNAHKTTFCEALLQLDPLITETLVVVIAGLPKTAAAWRNCVAPLFVIDPSKLEDEISSLTFEEYCIAYLRGLMQEMNRQVGRYEGNEFPVYRRLTLILDDIALYPQIMSAAIIKEIAGGSRHSETRIIIIAQELKQVAKQVRRGFGGVFCCGFFDEKESEDVHAHYATFLDKRTFQAQLSTRTEAGQLFIIDPDHSQCYYYEMPTWPFPHIRFGHPYMWEFSEERYISINEQRKQKQSKLEDSKTWTDRRGTIVVRNR